MKTIRKIVLYIVICLTLTTSAFAVNSDCVSISAKAPIHSDEPMAEEVVWVYAPIDGVRHKRLWSLTRGKWLTDWIPCN